MRSGTPRVPGSCYALPTRLRVLVTAGPTREKIDPVRFISNYSTGSMGYEIAGEARARGHAVLLVSGPTCLEGPKGVKVVSVESGREMRKAVLGAFMASDALIMAAAVSDWRPGSVKRSKIKRKSSLSRGGTQRLCVELTENPDILFEAGRIKERQVLAGFALETEGLIENAVEKLRRKNLDFIVANKLSARKTVFGQCRSDYVIIDKYGDLSRYGNLSKSRIARHIIDKVEAMCYSSP